MTTNHHGIVSCFRLHDRPFYVTAHASRRYTERVRPAKAGKPATDDLIHLAKTIGVIGACPDWLRRLKANDLDIAMIGNADLWLYLGDDIACPLLRHDDGLMLTTVMDRGGVAPETRERRNRKRKRHTPRWERTENRDTRGRRRPDEAWT